MVAFLLSWKQHLLTVYLFVAVEITRGGRLFWSIYDIKMIFKPSPPSAAYMRQCIGSALIGMMACSLCGAEPSSKPMLSYCLSLLISMLWHRQAIFESKGDKLSSSAECRIRTQGSRHLFISRLNADDKPTELSKIKLINLNSTARPSDQQAFSPLDLTASWFRTWIWRYTCLLLLVLMLWHRQTIFESEGDKSSSSAECRIRTQGLRQLFASRLNACWQPDPMLSYC